MEPEHSSEEEETKFSHDKTHKTKFEKLQELIDPEILKSWEKEQNDLVSKIKEYDDFTWTSKLNQPNTLRYVGGMDISFSPKNHDNACAYFAVFTYPELEKVYEDYEFVRMTIPYVPSFLAFREAPHLLRLYEKLVKSGKACIPQIIMLDGNGILHTRGCGLASHLGVLLNIPTIGASKTTFYVDGLTKDRVLKLCKENFEKGGDFVRLVGDSGRVWGAALKSNDFVKNPIFISIGTKISLDTALDIAQNVCIYRIPEPIREADLTSRKLVKKAKESDFP